MLFKLFFIQNTSIVFWFCFFGKAEIIEVLDRLVFFGLTYCATSLGNEIGKEKVDKIILDFIVYFDGEFLTVCRCSILS